MAVYNRKDSYYKKAKKEGYRSRAAYKLTELNGRFKIIKKGMKVLDCGAAPGGWSQVALEIVGPGGLVVGVDLEKIESMNEPNFIFVEGDFTDTAVLDEVIVANESYDAVISDIAPHTTGIRDTDHAGSVELVRKVYGFCKDTLKVGGGFLFKLFEGPEREKLVKELKTNFKDVKVVRPNATREGSMEVYVAAQGFLGKGKGEIEIGL